MINANELRIGNWVSFPMDVGVAYAKMAFIDNADNDTIYPIPLTPEILEMCGFEEEIGRRGVYFQNRLRILLKGLAYLIDEDDNRGYYIPNPCQYLHQLQNLY